MQFKVAMGCRMGGQGGKDQHSQQLNVSTHPPRSSLQPTSNCEAAAAHILAHLLRVLHSKQPGLALVAPALELGAHAAQADGHRLLGVREAVACGTEGTGGGERRGRVMAQP